MSEQEIREDILNKLNDERIVPFKELSGHIIRDHDPDLDEFNRIIEDMQKNGEIKVIKDLIILDD